MVPTGWGSVGCPEVVVTRVWVVRQVPPRKFSVLIILFFPEWWGKTNLCDVWNSLGSVQRRWAERRQVRFKTEQRAIVGTICFVGKIRVTKFTRLLRRHFLRKIWKGSKGYRQNGESVPNWWGKDRRASFFNFKFWLLKSKENISCWCEWMLIWGCSVVQSLQTEQLYSRDDLVIALGSRMISSRKCEQRIIN